MSEPPKFKTFRDLREIVNIPVKNSSNSFSDLSNSTSIPNSTSISSISSIPSIPDSSHLTKTDQISPVRDFQKVPNSISRNLNLFRGKSKQVWDYIWSVSRGSINPSRIVRKSRKEIKEGSKLGSMVTVDAAIEHLGQVKLLKVSRAIGSLSGNYYEIFTPEEINLTSTSSTSISSNTSLTQKLDILDIPETSISSITQIGENKDSYEPPKTSLKTNAKNDDDARENKAFSSMIESLDAAHRKITGKPASKLDAEKWATLADLLILELEIAASRADKISSVPAFLTEVLRRQLFSSRQHQPMSKSPKTKLDTVGRPDPGAYEIKPLDQKGREEALAQLREFAADDFLQDFRKWYTEEDWKWIMKELRTN